MAVSASVVLIGIDRLAGEIEIPVNVGAEPPDPPVPPEPLPPVLFTVSAADPLTPADKAEMVAVPLAIPFTVPLALTDATAEFEEFHCAREVRSFVVPSE
jgi:hypothetical protein